MFHPAVCTICHALAHARCRAAQPRYAANRRPHSTSFNPKGVRKAQLMQYLPANPGLVPGICWNKPPRSCRTLRTLTQTRLVMVTLR